MHKIGSNARGDYISKNILIVFITYKAYRLIVSLYCKEIWDFDEKRLHWASVFRGARVHTNNMNCCNGILLTNTFHMQLSPHNFGFE